LYGDAGVLFEEAFLQIRRVFSTSLKKQKLAMPFFTHCFGVKQKRWDKVNWFSGKTPACRAEVAGSIPAFTVAAYRCEKAAF
jgi:hypothetical protein